MSNLIVPDNSYVSLEEANQYHKLRASFESWNELVDEEKERRLVSASDFLDVNYQFSGQKADEEQPREFPRAGMDGTAKPIPKAVKFAVCELALQSDLNQNKKQKMSSVKVGPVSVNYEDQSATSGASNRFEYVKSILSTYLDK